ncbi:MAG: trypsin-like serine protease [Thiohalocapsa sp.]|nr:trypsin-like serine protease [Thiohalocapsa sp.]MCF7992733.1 trypsin-like serine protease [Thiohalocapsa sp.]
MKRYSLRMSIHAALTLAVSATPLVVFAESGVVSEPIAATATAAAQSDVMAYWTSDRIAAATAMVMVDTGEGDSAQTASIFEEGDDEQPMVLETSPGGFAEEDSNAFHQDAYPDQWEKLGEDMGALYIPGDELTEVLLGDPLLGDVLTDTLAGTKNIYTAYDVNVKTALWKLYPHRWQGKFTFTTPNGNSSCSATAISNNHIVTAAHCVYDTPSRNRWYTNKAFHPAYRNGATPYGTFATTGCTVLNAWVNLSGGYSINSWARHDVAVCNVGKNSAGKTLNQAVGWAGRSWNYGYNQLHFNAGYPARDYRDVLLSSPAQYLRSCTAESFKQTTDTVGMGCLYGRGISGGSWLRDYKANYISGSVNSVNSGLYIGQSNLYGPRFNSNNIVTLCNSQGC